jgi:hypothetical protein
MDGPHLDRGGIGQVVAQACLQVMLDQRAGAAAFLGLRDLLHMAAMVAGEGGLPRRIAQLRAALVAGIAVFGGLVHRQRTVWK